MAVAPVESSSRASLQEFGIHIAAHQERDATTSASKATPGRTRRTKQRKRTKADKRLAVTFMKGMIKVGRWANEHKHAAAAILDKQTFYLDVEHTHRGIEHIDMVPDLSPRNLVSVGIGKDFMLRHGYIKNDFDVHQWAAPEFLDQASRELLEERRQDVTSAKLPQASAPLGPGPRLG